MAAPADEYRSLLEELPLNTIEYAFAYGSGAVQQHGENKADKMVDFILATSDPHGFHEDNVAKNPSHYSTLRLLGPKCLAKIQTAYGARVYFNTQVHAANRTIKYGIISMDDLKSDLIDWNWLYVAGRLQKPVLEVISKTPNVSEWIATNRRSALQVALLHSKEHFSLRELFEQVFNGFRCLHNSIFWIVAISYTGDFRMLIGEDRNKISKIVAGNFPQLDAAYRPLLESDPSVLVKSTTALQQDVNPMILQERLKLLPPRVLRHIGVVADRADVSIRLSAAVKSIVAPVAIAQTVKNAFSAGLMRSLVYSMAKMSKMAKSMK
ncbi:unnamed protein product, partial [Mesorhabditis spiculigera]